MYKLICKIFIHSQAEEGKEKIQQLSDTIVAHQQGGVETTTLPQYAQVQLEDQVHWLHLVTFYSHLSITSQSRSTIMTPYWDSLLIEVATQWYNAGEFWRKF